MMATSGKKRRAVGPALDADASLYGSFSSAATAVAALYGHAAAQSKRSYAAGARDFAERMLAWARERQAAGEAAIPTAELVAALAAEAAALEDAEEALAAEMAAAAPHAAQPPPAAAQGRGAATAAHGSVPALSPAKQRAHAAAAAAAAVAAAAEAWRMQARQSAALREQGPLRFSELGGFRAAVLPSGSPARADATCALAIRAGRTAARRASGAAIRAAALSVRSTQRALGLRTPLAATLRALQTLLPRV
jgi:hypothetical protein